MLKPNLTSKLIFAAGLLLAAAQSALAVRTLPAGETVWQGDMTISETVRVPQGSRLVIRPGTVVRVTDPTVQLDISGVLVAGGTATASVRFVSPKGWQGISFVEAEQGSMFSAVQFADAETAISSIATDFKVVDSVFRDCGSAIKLLRESAPQITGNRFENNDMAVDNEMKSAPTILNNLFTGHRKTAILASHNSRGRIAGNRFEKNEQGIGLLQTYPDEIANNTFVDNRVALYCNQTKNSPRITGNHFERNEMALVNYSFAYPAIEDNTFLDNKMAIRNDQYGSAMIQHNLFRGNGTAIYNNRKSNPVLENNLIEKSELAMFCDYSSYPTVKNNNFLDNRMAVELGIYQSADWEKRSGSKPLMQKEAAARQSKNPMLSQAPTRFEDIVDVSGNWWGGLNAKMAQASQGENLPFFHDRLDKEWVIYDGFGPDRYRIDLVVYKPLLDNPVVPVGPRTTK